jgi:hypothetical protein
LEIVLQNEVLPVQVAIMDALPCSIGMILGNDWISKHKLTLTPHRLEIRFTNARQKEIVVHGLSTIVHQSSMPINKGIENDYDQLLNTMVNLGEDNDIPPTEVNQDFDSLGTVDFRILTPLDFGLGKYQSLTGGRARLGMMNSKMELSSSTESGHRGPLSKCPSKEVS